MQNIGEKLRETFTPGQGTQGHTYESREEGMATTGMPTRGTTTTTTATRSTGTQETMMGEGGEPVVCDREYFVRVEDRPVVIERVERVVEHRPVEKEYVVETRATGLEREVKEGHTFESLGTTERVVSEAAPKSPCE